MDLPVTSSYTSTTRELPVVVNSRGDLCRAEGEDQQRDMMVYRLTDSIIPGILRSRDQQESGHCFDTVYIDGVCAVCNASLEIGNPRELKGTSRTITTICCRSAAKDTTVALIIT